MRLKSMIGLFLISVAMLGLSACGGDNKGSGGSDGGDDAAASRPEVPADLKDKKAPDGFKADVAKGKVVYTACVACHGADAKGVEALNGADLTVADLADDYMYYRIVKGSEVKVKDSTMTGLPKGSDSDADYEAKVWNVIAYIKSLR